jgi:hypothetical protein
MLLRYSLLLNDVSVVTRVCVCHMLVNVWYVLFPMETSTSIECNCNWGR